MRSTSPVPWSRRTAVAAGALVALARASATAGAQARHPVSGRVIAQVVGYEGAAWLEQPCVRLIQPTERHWAVFQQMLTDGQATANLATDAHLAALAIEHGCELNSTDGDFARFPGLRRRNPLSPTRKAARGG